MYVIIALAAVAVTLLISIPVTANISVKRMSLRKRQKREETNFRSKKNVFYQKKKLLTKRQTL